MILSLDKLQTRIIDKSARLAVIGLGYVGVPVAAMFANAGFDVLGVEMNPERIKTINAGQNPIEGEEPGLADLIAWVVKSGKLHTTQDYAALKDCDVILIAVETPVNEKHLPEYGALRQALTSLASTLKDGALVIVESTLAPGTMHALVCPILEKGSAKKVNRDFYLGHCPERVMPGKLITNLQNIKRVVGGGSPETAQTMVSLYRHIIQAELDAADWITAELVKTVENSYRDIQIAFANEVALICEAAGGDVWKVRELVNKSPERHMHQPGAGVGGHCIPKDPWLLASAVKDAQPQLRLIPAARAVNDGMPAHMADLVKLGLSRAGITLAEARVLVLGYAYLQDSDDARNSPSVELVKVLQAGGAKVIIHDPFIEEFKGDIIDKARGCHVLVLMTAHSAYRNLDLDKIRSVMAAPVLVDGRNLFERGKAEAAGFEIYRLGDGSNE